MILGMLINIHELSSLASIFKMTVLMSTVSSKLESAIVKEHRRAPLCCIIVLSKRMIEYWSFVKRMPTGQNPVQQATQATKYYKSLSLLFLLTFLPRERLVASPVITLHSNDSSNTSLFLVLSIFVVKSWRTWLQSKSGFVRRQMQPYFS